MIIEISLAGFLFLFIIALNLLMVRLGNRLDLWDHGSDRKLQKITEDPKKYKLSVILGFIEHISVILLAILLFIAFSSYNMFLGIIWITFRFAEGLGMIYNETNDWKLINIAKQYSITTGAEQKMFRDQGQTILQNKYFRFAIISIFFSIGTFSYSIVFVTFNLVPLAIGWLGIVASIVYGSGNAIKLVKPKHVVLIAIGGLLVGLFEAILGGWFLLLQK